VTRIRGLLEGRGRWLGPGRVSGSGASTGHRTGPFARCDVGQSPWRRIAARGFASYVVLDGAGILGGPLCADEGSRSYPRRGFGRRGAVDASGLTASTLPRSRLELPPSARVRGRSLQSPRYAGQNRSATGIADPSHADWLCAFRAQVEPAEERRRARIPQTALRRASRGKRRPCSSMWLAGIEGPFR